MKTHTAIIQLWHSGILPQHPVILRTTFLNCCPVAPRKYYPGFTSLILIRSGPVLTPEGGGYHLNMHFNNDLTNVMLPCWFDKRYAYFSWDHILTFLEMEFLTDISPLWHPDVRSMYVYGLPSKPNKYTSIF